MQLSFIMQCRQSPISFEHKTVPGYLCPYTESNPFEFCHTSTAYGVKMQILGASTPQTLYIMRSITDAGPGAAEAAAAPESAAAAEAAAAAAAFGSAETALGAWRRASNWQALAAEAAAAAAAAEAAAAAGSAAATGSAAAALAAEAARAVTAAEADAAAAAAAARDKAALASAEAQDWQQALFDVKFPSLDIPGVDIKIEPPIQHVTPQLRASVCFEGAFRILLVANGEVRVNMMWGNPQANALRTPGLVCDGVVLNNRVVLNNNFFTELSHRMLLMVREHDGQDDVLGNVKIPVPGAVGGNRFTYKVRVGQQIKVDVTNISVDKPFKFRPVYIGENGLRDPEDCIELRSGEQHSLPFPLKLASLDDTPIAWWLAPPETEVELVSGAFKLVGQADTGFDDITSGLLVILEADPYATLPYSEDDAEAMQSFINEPAAEADQKATLPHGDDDAEEEEEGRKEVAAACRKRKNGE